MERYMSDFKALIDSINFGFTSGDNTYLKNIAKCLKANTEGASKFASFANDLAFVNTLNMVCENIESGERMFSNDLVKEKFMELSSSKILEYQAQQERNEKMNRKRRPVPPPLPDSCRDITGMNNEDKTNNILPGSEVYHEDNAVKTTEISNGEIPKEFYYKSEPKGEKIVDTNEVVVTRSIKLILKSIQFEMVNDKLVGDMKIDLSYPLLSKNKDYYDGIIISVSDARPVKVFFISTDNNELIAGKEDFYEVDISSAIEEKAMTIIDKFLNTKFI